MWVGSFNLKVQRRFIKGSTKVQQRLNKCSLKVRGFIKGSPEVQRFSKGLGSLKVQRFTKGSKIHKRFKCSRFKGSPKGSKVHQRFNFKFSPKVKKGSPNTVLIWARFWAGACPNPLFRFFGRGRYANTPTRCLISKSRRKNATFAF